MTVRRLSVLLALAALLVTGGCAGAGESGTPADAPSSAPTLPPAELPNDPPPVSLAPKGSAGAQTITGTVTSGVEPGCLLLTGGSESYLLIFEDAALRARAKVGARITVTGLADPTMMTTCQQGTPFVVASVRPAS